MADDLGRALQIAVAAWHAAFQREMDARGCAADAAGELLTQIPTEGLAQTALVERAGLSKQAVQQLLDRLEAQGLVERQAAPADRRMKHVVLTDAGRRQLHERRRVIGELEAQFRDKLGKKLSAKLDKALRRLAKD